MRMDADAGQRAVRDLPATASGVVVGAPGTGKTAVLIERVRRLVEAGMRPDSLLVLTPSRQTATALRDRLALAAGGATAGSLARSVASFSFQVVRAHALASEGEPPRLLTAADQDRIIADLLAGDAEGESAGVVAWPERLGPPVRQSREFRTQLRALAAECTELGLTPEALTALGDARGNPAWSAAGAFLREYRFVLDGMRWAHRDAAELVREAAATIASSESLAAVPGWPGELALVLVDDAQELTRAGVDLVAALRRRGVAVLAFGDPDIGSGAFRGASPTLFAHLCDVLGDVHVLDAQHRSGGPITDLVRSVTASIGAAGRVDHRRAPARTGDDDGHVRAVVAPSPFEEVDIVARTLREWHVIDGMPWSRMGVIAHDTRQVAELEIELAAHEVPTRAAGVQRPLGREQVVRDILGFVELGMRDPAERTAEELTSVLLSPFGGLDAIGLRRLRARLRHDELAAGGSRAASELLREALSHPATAGVAGGGIDGPENRVAARVAATLGGLHDAFRAGAGIHDLLWRVWDDARDATGRRLRFAWAELAASREPFAAEVDHSLDALVALFDAAKRHAEQSPDDGPGPFIVRILDSEVPEDTLTAPDDPSAVAVLTPDAALGTEFDGVVIAGVQDGVWPNLRLRGGLLDTWRLADDVAAWRAGEPGPDIPGMLDRRRAALHDELRLFVRAASRARRRLVVTAVDDDDLGPSPLAAFLPDPEEHSAARRDAEHPLTLRGLVAGHRRTLTTATAPGAREHAAGQLALLARHRVAGAHPDQWFGIAAPSSAGPLRDPDRAPVPVSPSKLGLFAECPLDWAIRALGGETRTWSAGVGTILHAAMEEVPGGDLEELTRVVEERWGELEFEAPWLARKERIWAETLTDRLHRYLTRFLDEGGRTLGAEARFRVAVGLDGESPEVRAVTGDERLPGRFAVLSGSIDRVEAYPAGRGEGVPVDPGRPGAERVLVVDLKTGRSENRLADAKVADDPQLAAYQLAVMHGLVEGADPELSAGARLVVLSHTTKTSPHYRLARQQRLDDADRAAFVARVAETARAMAAASFRAPIDAHCLSARFGVCAVHTVKAVSAA